MRTDIDWLQEAIKHFVEQQRYATTRWQMDRAQECEKTVRALIEQRDETFTAPDGRVFSNLCAFNHWTITRDFEARTKEYTDATNRANAAEQRASHLEQQVAFLTRINKDLNLRTPETVEVCVACGENQGDDSLKDWRECPQPKCPIRPAQASKEGTK